MRNRTGTFLRILLVLILLAACTVAALGVGAADRLPRLVAEKFGPASPSLGLPQRIIYALRLLGSESSLLTPLDPRGQPRDFTVSLGESVNSIAFRLEEEHFIDNAAAFRTYLVYAGIDTAVRAGKYQLSPSMTAVQIARKLQNAVPEEVEFHILPGWRAEEIANSLPTSGLSVGPDEFLQIVNTPPADLVPQGFPQVDTLEGFLMPGEYTIKRGINPHDLVKLFVDRFDQKVTAEIRDGFAKQGLALDQGVTLASVVQREAVVVDEQPIIASVFYNRLADGMKLESDPTVQYAIGYDGNKQTWWKNPLSTEDLQIDSRYNTYRYAGLPPGPISNPGIEALRAVAYPAQTQYFYFRALCDGSGRHAFSVTYDEHLKNACP